MGTQALPRTLMHLLPDTLGHKYLMVIKPALFIDVRGLLGQCFYRLLSAFCFVQMISSADKARRHYEYISENIGESPSIGGLIW